MESSSEMTHEENFFAVLPKCVLLVEDELLIRFYLADELRAAGYHVVEAFNADEALVLLASMAPDLVISDVRMPGSINGLGLLAIVREKFGTLPMIITSGHLGESQAISAGASKFIAKPFLAEAMIEAMRALLAEPD